QVGEEELAGAQHLALPGLRLLHLHDHLRFGEDVGGLGGDLRAGRPVGVVVEADALAGAGLHEHLVAVVDELAHSRRHEAHAVFVGFDFLGYADQHRLRSPCKGARGASLHYSTVFSTLPSLSNISSMWDFSTMSGGERAMMSPVTRISRPSS